MFSRHGGRVKGIKGALRILVQNLNVFRWIPSIYASPVHALTTEPCLDFSQFSLQPPPPPAAAPPPG